MNVIRVFFDVNEILIDSIPEPFVAGSLIAGIDAGVVEIRRAESDFLFAAIPWALVAARDYTTFPSSDSVMSYLATEFAKRGPVGDAFGVATPAGQNLIAGQPITVSRASGLLVPSRADTYTLAFVAGLTSQDTAAGFAVQPGRGAVTLDDWAAATGSTLLLQGQPYFLAPAGGLSAAPLALGAACVARVGIAASPTTLIVNPTDPILL